LSLDDDVAARLAREVRRTGRPLKVVVNDALRTGLEHGALTPAAPFRVDARRLRVRPGMDLDDIEGLLDRLDGPARP
jgi:hypothetical protein